MNEQEAKIKLLEDVRNLSDEEIDAVQGFVNYVMANPQRPKGFRPGYDTRGLEVVWRCGECGHTWEKREGTPETCPNCGAPKEAFYLVEED